LTQTIAPETTIGEVQLTVSNLDRSLKFYRDQLGFRLLSQEGGQAVLGAGAGFLRLFENPQARQVKGVTGLYHFAVLLPDRRSFARLIFHLAENGIEVAGVADHGVSEAIYMSDPDGNGIELYSDRRRNDWPRDDLGRLQMGTEQLDLEDLLLELRDGMDLFTGLPEDTRVGHIHLHVANLAEADHFYRQVMGFELMQRYGAGAMFFSAGGYHHHVGVNTWAGEGAPPPPPDAAGLRWFEIRLPGQPALDAISARLQAAGIAFEAHQGSLLLRDPSQNGILLTAG
jgi:catechol 2,3-dioxygenase